jgi:hypothetical protein
MAGSQMNTVELLTALTGLTHDVFTKSVVPLVRRKSIAARMYMDARADSDYQLIGQNLKFAVYDDFVTGGIATSGKIPDHIGRDAVQGTLNPIRRYRRIAMDNFVDRVARDAGAFEDFGKKLFDELWDSWYSMEVRHAIGYANGLIAKIESRTSSTKVILKDAFGYPGQSVLPHINKNSIICWYDVDGGAIAGAGKVTAVNPTTREYTIDSAATWEPAATTAANDLVYFATTPNITSAHFEAEKDLAPNGFGTILDPLDALTTVFGIAQGDHPRCKPVKRTSVTFTHMEVTRFVRKLASKRGFDVTPSTDMVLTYPAIADQLAESLMAFQQQAYDGTVLKGGYLVNGGSGNSDEDMPTAGLQVAGLPVYTDGFWYHDTLAIIPREKLMRAGLKDADFDTSGWGQWGKIADYDGQDAHVAEYMQGFTNDRGAFGLITGIDCPDVDDLDYDPATPTW